MTKTNLNDQTKSADVNTSKRNDETISVDVKTQTIEPTLTKLNEDIPISIEKRSEK